MKTHCRKGHELTPENLYGTRCRECRKIAPSTYKKGDFQKDPEKYRERSRVQDQKPEVKARRKEFYKNHKNDIWRRYSVLKSAAKRFGRDFTLTQEDYRRLVEPNKCHYCGGTLPEAGGGIDRQDHHEGYTIYNAVPCCERCNEHKGRIESIGLSYPRTVEILLESLHANIALHS